MFKLIKEVQACSTVRRGMKIMINELMSVVEPFLNHCQEVSSAGQETLPQVPENTSLSLHWVNRVY